VLIAPQVHQIPLLMSNAYLIVEADGLTLIDAGMSRRGGGIRRYIRRLGHRPEQLNRILVTHADIDHAGAVSTLKALSGARVYASAAEAQALRAGRSSRPLQLNKVASLAFESFEAAFGYGEIEVDEIVEDGDRLPILGGLRVVETPGHTPSHLAFYAQQAGVLFAGDAVRARQDELLLNRHPINTWDAQAVLASTRKLAALRPHIVCAGHGRAVYQAQGKFPL
jgi:glyoxylase-like metal-dependent hydrolase (beta-lactamase superfamily II)